jgi:hypothetical protein
MAADIKRVSFSERSRAHTLHVEIPGAIINVRRVRGPGNVPVTSIEILPDPETVFVDAPGSRAMNVRVTDGAEMAGILCATVPEERTYTIDDPVPGSPWGVFSFASFADTNPNLPPPELAAVAALDVGQSFTGGGGAFASWTIRRIR